MRWMALAVAALSILGGCAHGPKEPAVGGAASGTVGGAVGASAPAASGAAGNAPTPVAGTAGPSTRVAASASTALTDAAGRPVNRSLIAQGYQPSTYRGQLYYCRKEKLTGSQFTQRVCLTEQEAALQERIAQDEMNKRNSQGKCVPPLCPNH
jgi:hypothetical protein